MIRRLDAADPRARLGTDELAIEIEQQGPCRQENRHVDPLNLPPDMACQYSGGSEVKTTRQIRPVAGSRSTCHSQYSTVGR